MLVISNFIKQFSLLLYLGLRELKCYKYIAKRGSKKYQEFVKEYEAVLSDLQQINYKVDGLKSLLAQLEEAEESLIRNNKTS